VAGGAIRCEALRFLPSTSASYASKKNLARLNKERTLIEDGTFSSHVKRFSCSREHPPLLDKVCSAPEWLPCEPLMGTFPRYSILRQHHRK
jgi:hypothetical protein